MSHGGWPQKRLKINNIVIENDLNSYLNVLIHMNKHEDKVGKQIYGDKKKHILL